MGVDSFPEQDGLINVKKILLGFTLILSVVAQMSARPMTINPQQGQSAAPAKTTTTKPAADINSHILANGLEIVTVEDHSVPLVTIELAVRNGSFTEPPELNGLSHLYEHMFFKANRAIDNAEAYLQKIGQLGISYNGTTREEVVEYYFTTTSPNLRTAMNFMRDAARYPSFDKGEFEREREVVIGEIDRNESNPFYYLNLEMINRLFYKYPSRKNPLGNRQTVSSATTDMMRLIQARYYVPNNSALVVTGDVQTEEVNKLAEQLFGDWPRREKDPFVEFPMVEHPPLAKSEGAIRAAARAERAHQYRLARSINRQRQPGQLRGGCLLVHPDAAELALSTQPRRHGYRVRRHHWVSDTAQRRADSNHRADHARQSAPGNQSHLQRSRALQRQGLFHGRTTRKRKGLAGSGRSLLAREAE
jgi:hypothetical protein